jgi:hypothetical protein
VGRFRCREFAILPIRKLKGTDQIIWEKQEVCTLVKSREAEEENNVIRSQKPEPSGRS